MFFRVALIQQIFDTALRDKLKVIVACLLYELLMTEVKCTSIIENMQEFWIKNQSEKFRYRLYDHPWLFIRLA